MSLPPEHRTQEMDELEARLAKMSPEDFSALVPLTPQDHQLIGTYVQLYNFIDFNLRRSIELFWYAKMLPSAYVKRYPKYRDAELPGIVAEVVETMDANVEDIPKSLEFLKKIELGRPFRNLLGHFAAKRINDDAIVFASKDERDAEKVRGKRLKKGHVLTATTKISALRDLAIEVVPVSDWVAFKFPDWSKRYDKG